MRNGLIKWMILSIAAMLIYQNRYKLLNMILGMKLLRTIAIRGFLKMPGVREKIVQDMF
ncbi:hypothetical protein [Pseudalkalibacillus berkeleyi]|uniref:Uncharacterized protein n=1 Tax=Pseudalkalibacillus berkeleyi TaxID=1069813 RepID=A0ABS9H1K0_9BACL|nr:hypothetical protein [Pseudalkalibacillus berkeleyi]MCF6137906.1 hypothetical protein [Pseudalkalibacillus berkeleyi]